MNSIEGPKQTPAQKRRLRRQRNKIKRKLEEKHNLIILEKKYNLEIIFKEYPSNILSAINEIADCLSFIPKSTQFFYKNESIYIYIFSSENMSPLAYHYLPIEVDKKVLKKLKESLSKDKQIQKCASPKCSYLVDSILRVCKDCVEDNQFSRLLQYEREVRNIL